MIVSWTSFKQFAVAKSLAIQWIDIEGSYYLAALDGPFKIECILNKSNLNTDLADFETNFKNTGNKALWQYDSDGAAIIRVKAAKKGWSYAAIPIEFQTARLSDTLYSKMADGTDRTGITIKAYNAQDQEVTTPGLLNANYATIVKTVIDFEPAYDYEVIGGFIRTINDITADIRMWIIAVPDVPAGSGGSKEMVGGLNLNYMKPENVYFVDGRVTKLLTYDATYHTNKIRIVLKYPAGTNEAMSINFELYRQ